MRRTVRCKCRPLCVATALDIDTGAVCDLGGGEGARYVVLGGGLRGGGKSTTWQFIVLARGRPEGLNSAH
jgi:hypothetical protein